MMKCVAEWYGKQCEEKRERKEMRNDRTDRKERREYKFGGLPQDW